MKKGIVLLTTIFFITAISILILKNLDDTQKYVDNSNHIFNNSQIMISIVDLKNEVVKLLIKNKDILDESIETGVFKESISFDINNIKIDFDLKKYEKSNVNEIKNKESKIIEELFQRNDIYSYPLFEIIYYEKLQDKNKKVESHKQLNDIINTFYERTYNKNVFKLNEILGIINPVDVYELNILVEFNSKNVEAQYLLKSDGKVMNFEISFK